MNDCSMEMLTGLFADALASPLLAKVLGPQTPGSVVFVGASGGYSENNSSLFWDDTNKFLGIGTSAPGYPLTITTSNGADALFTQGNIYGWNIAPRNSIYFYVYDLLMSPSTAVGDTGNAYTFSDSSGDTLKQIKASSLLVRASLSASTLAVIGTDGNIKQAMGATTTLMTSVGVADVQTSASGVGNAADTTDDTLHTYSLPLNSLSANGKFVWVSFSFHLASNGNDKRAKMWCAGTAIADTGVLTANNVDGFCWAKIIRIDSTHVSGVGVFLITGLNPIVTVTPNLVVANLTTNNSIIKSTGASPTTGAANDVVGYMLDPIFGN
jgi:hypothetical protein